MTPHVSAPNVTPERLMERYVKNMRPQMRVVTTTLKTMVIATHGTPRIRARPDSKIEVFGVVLSITASIAKAYVERSEIFGQDVVKYIYSLAEAVSNNAGRTTNSLLWTNKTQQRYNCSKWFLDQLEYIQN